MAHDEDEDLYDEEFDFVDDDETPIEDSELTEEESARDRDQDREPERDERDDEREPAEDGNEADEPVDEYGRPEPKPDYVVHVYEHRKFTRTIDRPFTPEDAEAFATEFNRTSKNYGRIAVTSKNDAKPKKTLD